MILILLLLVPAMSYKVTDLTKSSGITPVRVQNSFIINGTYTYMHNINITRLHVELTHIEDSVNLLRAKDSDKNRCNILRLYLDDIKLKFDHIHINNLRIKRGLINGLGSAISWITGNMDSDDKAKYDKILEKVQANEYHLEHNVENQLSINRNLIHKFNNGIDVIHANNVKLKNYFNSITTQFTSIELTQQHSFLFNTLTLIKNKIDDIMVSLEFCRLNIIHSSILSRNELSLLIHSAKLSLISDEPEILWQLGSAHCHVKDDFITYFIQLPLYSHAYETFFLLSYPVVKGNELRTIVEHPSFIIRKDNSLFTGDCLLIRNNYYCKNMSRIVNKCISQLLDDKDLHDCKSLVISEAQPFIRYIQVINKYLMFNITTCTISKQNQNITIYPRKTQLLNLEESEKLFNFLEPYVYWESIVSLPSEQPARTLYTNLSFDLIHKANLNIEPLEIIEDFTAESNYLLHYILIPIGIFVLLIIIAVIYYKCKISLKFCNRNIPDKKQIACNLGGPYLPTETPT